MSHLRSDLCAPKQLQWSLPAAAKAVQYKTPHMKPPNSETGNNTPDLPSVVNISFAAIKLNVRLLDAY